jgi:uncharacterized protein DUF6265
MRWLNRMLVGWLVPAAAHAQSARLDEAAWLRGCWEETTLRGTVEERWLAPRGGSMLNLGRTVRDGRLLEYEVVLLTEQDGRLAYEAHPSGQAAATFRSTHVSDSLLVFEDPAHDFPQRVAYQRRGTDSLLAWIEGTANGQTRHISFPFARVSCD